jgi:O-antigen/teichoic acid export membrane protein
MRSEMGNFVNKLLAFYGPLTGWRSQALKNLGSLGAAQAASLLLNFFLNIALARLLTVERFGVYGLANNLIFILIVLGNFGLTGLGIRDVARDTEQCPRYLKNILGLRIGFSLLASIIMAIVPLLMGKPREVSHVIFVFAAGFFFLSLADSFRWVFNAFQAIGYEALVRFLERALVLGLSLAVLLLGAGLKAVAWVFLGAQLIQFLFSAALVRRKFCRVSVSLDPPFCRYMLSESFYFALAELFWSLYFYIDIVMLSYMKGDGPAGIYRASYILVNACGTAPTVFMVVLFPVFSKLYAQSLEEFKKVYRKTLTLFLAAAIPLAVFLFIFAGPVINFFFSNRFADSVPIFRILIFTIVFGFPSALFANVLSSANRQKKQAQVNAIGALLNITLNLVLIPRWSYWGAGAAALITAAFVAVGLWFQIRSFLGSRCGVES